jgi:hypothetical protein
MFDAMIKTHVANDNEHTIAMQAVRSVLYNRRDDLAASIKLLSDQAFVDSLAARATAPDFKAPEQVTSLGADKIEEERATFALGKEGKLQTPMHSLMTFLGQHISHAKLEDAFKPGSEVASKMEESINQSLESQLKQQPSDEEKAAAKAVLNDWLIYRSERAHGVMTIDRPDSEMVQSTVSDWNKQRLAQGKEQVVVADNNNVKDGMVVANENRPQPQTEMPGEVAVAPKEAAVAPIPDNILKSVEVAEKLMADNQNELGKATGTLGV